MSPPITGQETTTATPTITEEVVRGQAPAIRTLPALLRHRQGLAAGQCHGLQARSAAAAEAASAAARLVAAAVVAVLSAAVEAVVEEGNKRIETNLKQS